MIVLLGDRDQTLSRSKLRNAASRCVRKLLPVRLIQVKNLRRLSHRKNLDPFTLLSKLSFLQKSGHKRIQLLFRKVRTEIHKIAFTVQRLRRIPIHKSHVRIIILGKVLIRKRKKVSVQISDGTRIHHMNRDIQIFSSGQIKLIYRFQKNFLLRCGIVRPQRQLNILFCLSVCLLSLICAIPLAGNYADHNHEKKQHEPCNFSTHFFALLRLLSLHDASPRKKILSDKSVYLTHIPEQLRRNPFYYKKLPINIIYLNNIASALPSCHYKQKKRLIQVRNFSPFPLYLFVICSIK